MSRRPCRALLPAALAAAAAAALWDSNRRLVTTEYTVSSPRIPRAFDGFRITQLSDLHGIRFGRENVRLIGAVARTAPDLIAVTGDLTDEYTGDRYAAELIRPLAALAPVCFVPGNHEWRRGGAEALCRTLESAGALVLRDRAEALSRDGARIVLAGLDDPLSGTHATPDSLMDAVREEYGDPFTIMLYHRNDRLPAFFAAGTDLVLSGHAHGGVVRLPLTDGMVGPGPELLPVWTSGVCAMGRTRMVVSRGLGSHSGMLRLFNNPELVVITLRAE